MNQEFQYPRGVRSSLKLRLAETESGPHVAIASKLFLDAMRPVIQNAIDHNENGRYVTPGAMEDYLAECDRRFNSLQEFVKKLPAHVRYELGIDTVLELEENLKILIKPKRTRNPKLPGASNFFRTIFLHEMMHEYRKAFGEFPEHTYSRTKDPEESKTKGFHGVAYKMCELAGFIPRGVEDELAGIKKIKTPRSIEEVRAEIQARKEAQSAE